MARGVNKVIILGNLGQDPDTRYNGSGGAIVNLSVATDESYKDRNTGQLVPRTEWHRVVIFNKLAEIASQHLRKGAKVYVEGRLQTRKWQDQSGQDRYTTEIVAEQMRMLSARDEAQGQPPAQTGTPNTAPQPRPPRQPAAQQAPMDDFDDDIPF